MQEKSKPMPIVDYIKRVNHLYANDSAPENKASAVSKTADDTRWNKTTGKFEDIKGDPVEPHDYLKKQKTVKDGLGNNVKDYIYNPAENKFEHKDDLVHESPLPVGMEREPKIHTPAYRRKYPERYGHKYTSKLDQAAYPKPGTAPSEKIITDAEIQKRIDKSRGPSDWDLIKQTAKKPSEKREVRRIVNEQYLKNPQSLSKDDWKYVDRSLIKPVKIFSNDDPTSFLSNESQRRAVLTPEKFTKPPQYPEVRLAVLPEIDPNQKAREAALERTRAYAFAPRPDPDASRGIGSFKNTIGRKLRAESSRRDWEKRNQIIYKG